MYSSQTLDHRKKLSIAKREMIFPEGTVLNEYNLLSDTVVPFVTYVEAEYPIVDYSSKNAEILNYFVKSITVSIVYGKKISFRDDGTSIVECMEHNAVAYVAKPSGEIVQIINGDICKLLYMKPNLAVTKEGFLIFYTQSTLFVTLDCMCATFVDIKEIAEGLDKPGICEIVSVDVDSSGSTSILFKEGYKCTLKIDFDMTSEDPIIVNII